MGKVSIRHPGLYRIYDETEGALCSGFRQEWYPTRWQRLSGCGPTNAAAILYYLENSERAVSGLSGAAEGGVTAGGAAAAGGADAEGAAATSGQALQWMQRLWRYVKPTMHGVSSTAQFARGLRAYARAVPMDLHMESCDIPADPRARPGAAQTASFVEEALQNDRPVAFLNLHNGGEPELDGWHWVTIAALGDREGGDWIAGILDDGLEKQVNLTQWLKSTTLGGGFVRFWKS